MGLTALGFIAARILSAGNPHQAFGRMTASFGIGQMVGPTLAGFLSEQLGDFRVASLIAAGALVAAAALSIRTSRVMAANASAESAIQAFTAPRTALDRGGRTARR
jgi:predicted MFS family arabinose efflux permease